MGESTAMGRRRGCASIDSRRYRARQGKVGLEVRVPDAVQRSPGDAIGSRECAPDDRLRIVRSRCAAEPGPTSHLHKMDPGCSAPAHSASKTRVNALMSASKTRVNALMALRCIRGTRI